VNLAELDLFDVVEVPSGPEHDEERVVISLDLGALMGVNGVFDGQWM
jgi:hypothetical protein